MRIAWLLLLSVSVFADVVTMKDGHQISGHVESADSREMRIKVGDSIQTIAVDQVGSVRFDAQGGSSETPLPPIVPPPPPPGDSETKAPVPPSTPAPLAGQSFTLPAGSEIAIRTIDRIESKTADLGSEYAASIDDALVQNGVTVIPAHAKAFLRVINKTNPLFKRPALTVALVGVMVGGKRINVESGSMISKGGASGRAQKTATAIGAGGGALVGVVFGGPAGAGLGALTGAATGYVVAKVVGKGVVIGPEIRFTYKLSQAVVINSPLGAR